MIRILIILLMTPVLFLPIQAGAAAVGLDRIEITPAQTPEDPSALVDLMEKRAGFLSAAWDAEEGRFVIAVEDSLPVDTPQLREEFAAMGLEGARMNLLLETMNAVVVRNAEASTATLVSAANGIDLPVRSTVHARRFWGFWGSNPRGQDADFRLTIEVIPGALSADGVAAPDTADILYFELTKPAYKNKPR